ncbi:MAG: biotin/lipoyl-binding protein [gamma proteobacterium symbiont of Bathyaustriella thionipta]|nr:biotin/lipoyl-binding protein [gamma proteobacterium symbiont of Bathyaustriella thionipta]
MHKIVHLHPLLLLCATMLLGACDKPAPETAPVSSRLVKTFIIEDANGGNFRNFPATVEANRKADLAFRVPGTVAELLVREGQQVKAGDVLVQLDQTDFKITLNDRQARYSRASKDFLITPKAQLLSHHL